MANKKKEVEVKEQKTVVFYDDELTAVLGTDGEIYVSVNQMCKILGLKTRGQQQRIERQDILRDGQRVCKIHTHSRGLQLAGVLKADLVPIWLAGIRTASIEDEIIKEKLKRFQAEAARVLWQAFQAGELTPSSGIEGLIESGSDIEEALKAVEMAEAVLKIARSHLRLAQSVRDNRGDISANTERIELIEAALGNSERYVSLDQASNIKEAVKVIALELGRASGKNEYGGVYGEMYRRYGVTSYKEIPAPKYEEVMSWLRDWYGGLADDMPF